MSNCPRVGRSSSAFAVDITGPAWLSLDVGQIGTTFLYSAMRYLILLILAITTCVIGYFLRDKGYWLVDNLSGNLPAGFLGSLAILFFVERAIEKKRQQERTRIAGLALRQIRLPLQKIVILFAEMIKASAPKPFCSLPASLHELFNPVNTAHLDWLDLDGPTGHVKRTDWKTESEAILTSELEHLTAILDRYLTFLDIQLVEAIDSLIQDSFLRFVRTMRSYDDAIRKLGRNRRSTIYGSAAVRDEFFARLLAVAKQLELAGGKAPVVPTSLVRQDMMPKAGQARLKSLPPPVIFCDGDPPVGGPGGPQSGQSVGVTGREGV